MPDGPFTPVPGAVVKAPEVKAPEVTGSGLLLPGAKPRPMGPYMVVVDATDDHCYLLDAKGASSKEALVTALVTAMEPSYPAAAAEYVHKAAQAVVGGEEVPEMTPPIVDGVLITGHDDDDAFPGVLRFVPTYDRYNPPRVLGDGRLFVCGVVDTEDGDPSDACATFAQDLLDGFLDAFVAKDHVAELRAQFARLLPS